LKADLPKPVLVVDFGAQYAQLIARRVRELGLYSEIVSHHLTAAEILAKQPSAILLSGGPASVYEDKAPVVGGDLFASDVPIFGICYGFQYMAQKLGGEVGKTGIREYGSTELTINSESSLFSGLSSKFQVWMSHGDSVTKAPAGFDITASTASCRIASFENRPRRLAGVQYHPEVIHSKYGNEVLSRFLFEIAGLQPNWTTDQILDDAVLGVRNQVGTGLAICGLSGGVDSAVAAAIVQKAIGDQLTAVFVDHGLLRTGEREQVEQDFVNATGTKLVVVDARDRFLKALEGISDPEQKRKIIGAQFIRVFEESAKNLVTKSSGEVKFLVQGTLYPDVVESGGGSSTATIKSHHNVGGLPDDLKFDLVEPLRTLFKDEVRTVGRSLGLPESIVGRHPFPGPGLAIRIVGAVDQSRLDILRAADAIARLELEKSGLNDSVWQFPVVLLADVRSVGVQGDGRTYGHPIVLRPVSSEDAMTADWSRLPYELIAKISSRITNEVPEVNRVVLDVTSKPPGTIEWE
jgi:GMP synthase (glutamine-hydrolysing)